MSAMEIFGLVCEIAGAIMGVAAFSCFVCNRVKYSKSGDEEYRRKGFMDIIILFCAALLFVVGFQGKTSATAEIGKVQCEYCGAEITIEEKYCANCGYKIDWNTITAKQQAKNIKSHCENCNIDYEEDYKFCPKCGKATTRGGFCTGCGAVVEDKYKFCPECGEKIKKAN